MSSLEDTRDRNDWLDSEDYRQRMEQFKKLERLRQSGLREFLFCLSDPVQLTEYQEARLQLGFFGHSFQEARLEGNVFLFVEEEDAEFVSVPSGRTRVKKVLDDAKRK